MKKMEFLAKEVEVLVEMRLISYFGKKYMKKREVYSMIEERKNDTEIRIRIIKPFNK